MGAQSVTLKKGCTAFTPTGGTDVTYTPDGVSIPNGLHLAAASVADFRVRPSITLKTRNPQLVNGSFTKAKRWLTYTLPSIDIAGVVTYSVVRIEVETAVELTAAEALDLAYQGVQLLYDADLAAFVASGSLA